LLLGEGWRLAMVGQSKVGTWVKTASALTPNNPAGLIYVVGRVVARVLLRG
jgi:hypothetical protein